MSLSTSDGPGWATPLNGVQQAIVAAHPTRDRMGQDGPGWARGRPWRSRAAEQARGSNAENHVQGIVPPQLGDAGKRNPALVQGRACTLATSQAKRGVGRWSGVVFGGERCCTR